MQRMKKDAFCLAYVLCESLIRGPEYIDAMTDPQTYQQTGDNDLPNVDSFAILPSPA